MRGAFPQPSMIIDPWQPGGLVSASPSVSDRASHERGCPHDISMHGGGSPDSPAGSPQKYFDAIDTEGASKLTRGGLRGKNYTELVLGGTNDLDSALQAFNRNIGCSSAFSVNRVGHDSSAYTTASRRDFPSPASPRDPSFLTPRDLNMTTPRSPRAGGPLARTAMSSLLSGYDTVPSSSVARSEFPVFDAEYKHQLAEANSSLLWNKKRDQFTAYVEQRAKNPQFGR